MQIVNLMGNRIQRYIQIKLRTEIYTYKGHYFGFFIVVYSQVLL